MSPERVNDQNRTPLHKMVKPKGKPQVAKPTESDSDLVPSPISSISISGRCLGCHILIVPLVHCVVLITILSLEMHQRFSLWCTHILLPFIIVASPWNEECNSMQRSIVGRRQPDSLAPKCFINPSIQGLKTRHVMGMEIPMRIPMGVGMGRGGNRFYRHGDPHPVMGKISHIVWSLPLPSTKLRL